MDGWQGDHMHGHVVFNSGNWVWESRNLLGYRNYINREGAKEWI